MLGRWCFRSDAATAAELMMMKLLPMLGSRRKKKMRSSKAMKRGASTGHVYAAAGDGVVGPLGDMLKPLLRFVACPGRCCSEVQQRVAQV